jgi:hypothetical protein
MNVKYLLFVICLAFAGNSKSQIVSIPYNDDIKVPVIILSINGQDYRFIIDMGAEVSIINSRYVSLSQRGKIRANDANNTSKTIYKNKITSLVIGANKEISISNVMVYSTEIDENIFNCNEIAGILGMDILGNYVVELDPKTKMISFYNESPVKKDEMLPFGKKGNRPSVDVRINDQTINLLLDSGSAGFIRVSNMSGFKYDRNTAQKFRGYSAVGLYGRKEGLINSEIIKGDISIGNILDHDQVVMIEPTNSSKLGFEYLRHFHVIVSVKDRMLMLKKVEDFQCTDILMRFGFFIGIDQGDYVITRKNVSRTDLEVGDKVLEVNNKVLESPCDINKVKDAIGHSDVTPVLVIDRKGQRLTIDGK